MNGAVERFQPRLKRVRRRTTLVPQLKTPTKIAAGRIGEDGHERSFTAAQSVPRYPALASAVKAVADDHRDRQRRGGDHPLLNSIKGADR